MCVCSLAMSCCRSSSVQRLNNPRRVSRRGKQCVTMGNAGRFHDTLSSVKHTTRLAHVLLSLYLSTCVGLCVWETESRFTFIFIKWMMRASRRSRWVQFECVCVILLLISRLPGFNCYFTVFACCSSSYKTNAKNVTYGLLQVFQS